MCHAIGTHKVIRVITSASGLLPAIVKAARAVGVVIHHRKMVEDIPEFRGGPHLSAAKRNAFYRRFVLHNPGHLINAVDSLLDDMVARQPRVIIPVLYLILHVSPIRFARARRPDRAGVIDGVESFDVADRAIVDFLHDRADTVVVAVTETRHEREALLLRFLRRLENAAYARRIRGHRLFGKHMFSSLYRSPEMNWPESRRRSQQHHIHAAINQLLIGIQTDETFFWGHLDRKSTRLN